MTWRPLPSVKQCVERLELLFPRESFDTVMSNPLAGWAVASMIYMDAVVPASGDLPGDATWVRPTMVLWMPDEVYARTSDTARGQWTKAAVRDKRSVAELLAAWGLPFNQKYGDNTRETLRSDTFPSWLAEGAMRTRPGIKTTSPAPRWALTDAFADLFEPTLEGKSLQQGMEKFRQYHMSPGGKLKALTARQRGDQLHAVDVTLPDGTIRRLEPGETSVILKGVVEEWAPSRLEDPVVLTISEPGDKIYTADSALIKRLGLEVDATNLLPDALLVDIGSLPPQFWIVEVVATDGPINESRKKGLLKWAKEQRISEDDCNFLTAFGSRNATPAKKRLKDLATGTVAWFADEPSLELVLRSVSARD